LYWVVEAPLLLVVNTSRFAIRFLHLFVKL